ncbi:MAG: hypothetical protein IPQ07_10655 [Myxococcales bacterium]|nr:hypothetical protein [Myxococcales bacterium]
MRALALAVLILIVAAPAAARADDDERPELQKMRFVERGEQLHVTASLAKLFDRAAYEALDSGFTSTAVIRIWIYPRDSTEPVAFMLIQRQVLYNLWDEVYELKFDESAGRKVVKEKRKAEALRRITSLDDLAVAPLASLPYDQIYLLAMEVELNPVSKETLAQVRRWLSQGTGGGLDRGGAFFGSFVSVFVNPKIAEADRVIRIRSQPFYRPKP